MNNQFIHQVFFRTASEAGTRQLAAAFETLKAIEGINVFFTGRPANNTAKYPVADNSYQLVLLISFNTEAERDNYELHPVHVKLVQDYRHLWTKAIVYDFLG